MHRHEPTITPPGEANTDEQLWLRASDWTRDLGDRALCGVMVVSAALAFALGVMWLLAMPSFG